MTQATNTKRSDDMTADHVFALEFIAEQLLPLLIKASPAREEIALLLESWAARETSVGEEVVLGTMADEMLNRIASPP